MACSSAMSQWNWSNSGINCSHCWRPSFITHKLNCRSWGEMIGISLYCVPANDSNVFSCVWFERDQSGKSWKIADWLKTRERGESAQLSLWWRQHSHSSSKKPIWSVEIHPIIYSTWCGEGEEEEEIKFLSLQPKMRSIFKHNRTSISVEKAKKSFCQQTARIREHLMWREARVSELKIKVNDTRRRLVCVNSSNDLTPLMSTEIFIFSESISMSSQRRRR